LRQLQQPWPWLPAYAKVGSSFRIPNVNDNFNLFTATVNLLEPQTARDRELGLRSVRGARYRLAIYEIQLDNEILLDPVTYSNRNLPPTRRRGAEAEARWQATEGLYFSAAYTVVDLKLSHEQADWRFTASVQNLLNRQYYSYGIYTGFPSYSALPAPERTFYLSARRSFN
jgi:outer membrane receptor protein involved in Fe transport